MRSSLLKFISALSFALLTLSGCGDGGTSPPVPTSVSPSGGGQITGTVGSAVTVSIGVTGKNGKPVAGVSVNFTVSSGGGSVSPPQATTDSQGRASASWTLGTAAGTQRLTCTAGGISTQFEATAAASTPTVLEALTAYTGQFDPDEALSTPASFKVADQYGNGVANVTVSFQASDGGSVSPAQETTGSAGTVQTIWTLGPDNGTQTLTAQSGSLTPASVQAVAYDPCQDIGSLTMGQPITGTLGAGDCVFEQDDQPFYADKFNFTVGSAGAYTFRATTSFTDPRLFISDLQNRHVGVQTDGENEVVFRAFLDATAPAPVGPRAATSGKEYQIWVYPKSSGDQGGYTLTPSTSDGQMRNCEAWLTTDRLTSQQSVAATDCTLTDGAGNLQYADRLGIRLRQGEGIVVTMSSTQFDSYVGIAQGATWLVLDDDSGGGLNAYLTFTATEDGYFDIWFMGANFWITGNYDLTISPLTTAAPPQGTDGPSGLVDPGSRILPSTAAASRLPAAPGPIRKR